MKINDSYFLRDEGVETRRNKTIHGKTFQQLPVIFYASKKKVLETFFSLLHVCDKMMLLQNNLLKGESLFSLFFFLPHPITGRVSLRMRTLSSN